MSWKTDPAQPCTDQAQLEPITRTNVQRLVRDAAKKGIRVLVYETVRTRARQRHLYGSGRSRRGPILTKTLDSCHLYREAVDVVVLDRAGRADWSQAAYRRLFAACPPRNYGLELLSWERPHLQRAGANGPGQNVTAAVQAKKWGLRVAYP